MESLFEQRKGNEMTFLEKAKEIEEEEANGLSEYGIISGMCPHHYGLESKNKSCTEDSEKCRACWNREMPSEDKPFTHEEVAEERGYNKGFDDACKFTKKIWDMNSNERYVIFGSYTYEGVLTKFTPQEALAKLKAYEERIEVGDVITYSGEKGLVLDIKGSKVVVLTDDGCVQEWYECDVEKTGKHIDIKSILKQIGGE